MKAPPAFQFYPADFLSDGKVLAMNLSERGAYITLLCVCWREGSIPVEAERLARLCQTTVAEFSVLWPAVAPCFREHQGVLRHKRLDEERRKQEIRHKRLSDAGKLGGSPAHKNGNPSQATESLELGFTDAGSDGVASSRLSSSSLSSRSKSTPKRRPWKVCPEDWEPAQKHRERAAELQLDLDRELTAFREWEFKDPKTDANLAFLRWLREARERIDKGGNGNGNGATDRSKKSFPPLPRLR